MTLQHIVGGANCCYSQQQSPQLPTTQNLEDIRLNYKCNSQTIYRIAEHKAVKNSFHFLVHWFEENKQAEWIKKADIEPLLIQNYVQTLPEKTLKQSGKSTIKISKIRFSERIAQKQ